MDLFFLQMICILCKCKSSLVTYSTWTSLFQLKAIRRNWISWWLSVEICISNQRGLRGIAERKLRLRRFYAILLGKNSYTFKGIAERTICVVRSLHLSAGGILQWNMSQFDGMNCNLLGSWGLDCKASIDSWALAEFSRRKLLRRGLAISCAGWSENGAYGVVDKVWYCTSPPVWIYQAPIYFLCTDHHYFLVE